MLEFHNDLLSAIHDPMCIPKDPKAFLLVIHVIFHVLMEILYCSYAKLSEVCYLGMLVDCNRSGCDREGDIDWHMSYKVTVPSLNPTQYLNISIN